MSDPVKGKRYINLLESARTNGSWNEFAELIRKVAKHAPQEQTLIHTATAEHFVATYTPGRRRRPHTATPQSSDPCIETLLQTVQAAPNPLAEQTFHGQACLLWATWIGLIKNDADWVPRSDIVAFFDLHGQKSTSTWTKICLLKTALVRGKVLADKGEQDQAMVVFKAATSWIELNLDLVKSVPQLAFWAEQLLAEHGCAVSDGASDAASVEARQDALQLWSQMATKNQEVSAATYGYAAAHPSRSDVWEAYYRYLSNAMKQSNASSSHWRVAQATQLRIVEAAYETALLKSRKFPKATESNSVIEGWVEGVIQNWTIMCGSGWHEHELGTGGRNGLTRNVLDILYRAAMKTFHSTLILRRLFQVHKSLTEFNLAYSCLDTYIELVDQARERASKAGHSSPESEEIMLLTISEGIEGLCSFGGQNEAKKAFGLACKLENWLEDNDVDQEEYEANGLSNGHADSETPPSDSAQRPSDGTLETVYRAIGVGKAQWARWTPYSENRSELQSEALAALRKAVSLPNPEIATLYTIAILSAETRDIPQALRWTKIALQRSGEISPSVPATRQCTLWHLMTLLLTSQQDFDTALQSSAAALDTIASTVLQYQQTEIGSKESNAVISPLVAADLECNELEKLIELQITSISLVELVDGPEAALNQSEDLLSFYSKLFGRFDVNALKAPTEENLVPPKTSAGTIKSTRGSMFSRRKPPPSIAPSAATGSLRSEAYSIRPQTSARPQTQASQAPTIQVTDTSGKTPKTKHHHHLVHRHREKATSSKNGEPESRPATAILSKATNEGEPGSVASTGAESLTVTTDGPLELTWSSVEYGAHPELKQASEKADDDLAEHDNTLAPYGQSVRPPQQDARFPQFHSENSSSSPVPRFSKTTSQKHALVVLVKMWLTIATLYRRSHMFDDARESCEEASKAASRIEALVSGTDPSARALSDAGWGGGGKSSDGIWADVHCSKAELLHAISQRRAEEGTLATSETLREIVDQYEHCLMYEPNHTGGVIGLSNILLDYYEKKIDLAKRVDDGRSYGAHPTARLVKEDDLLGPGTASQEHLHEPPSSGPSGFGEDLRKTPDNLNRIAARDRAYGLLNTLSKLGHGWDNAEVWFTLSRAHELGGEIEKAKQILWWCIDLEDTRPIRHWSNLGCRGYVL